MRSQAHKPDWNKRAGVAAILLLTVGLWVILVPYKSHAVSCGPTAYEALRPRHKTMVAKAGSTVRPPCRNSARRRVTIVASIAIALTPGLLLAPRVLRRPPSTS